MSKTKDKPSKSKGSSTGDILVDASIGTASIIAGAAAGSFVGRPSFAIGIVSVGGGIALAKRFPKYARLANALTFLGAGMISAPLPEDSDAPASTPAVNGLPTKADALAYYGRGKARTKHFGQGLAKKLYLDKTPLKSPLGLGEVKNDVDTQTSYLQSVLQQALKDANNLKGGIDGIHLNRSMNGLDLLNLKKSMNGVDKLALAGSDDFADSFREAGF